MVATPDARAASVSGEVATGHAGVFGATSRVACQSLLTAAVVVCDRPAIGAASADVGGVDRAGSADLGREQPDRAATDEVGQRVDEAVDEVTVVVAPPQQDRVDDVAVVAVDHVGVDAVLDRDAQLVIGVVVPAEFLDDHAGLEPEPVSRSCHLGQNRPPSSSRSASYVRGARPVRGQA